MIEKTYKLKPILKILIFTVITLCCWLGFDLWRTLSKKSEPELNEELIKPLNPNLDLKLIEGLQNRISPTQEDFLKIPQKFKLETSPEGSPSTAVKKVP